VETFPFIYHGNKKGWVTTNLVLEWFEEYFTPEATVQCLLVDLDPECKIVLLFDKHLPHQNADLLVKVNVHLSHSTMGILRFITCENTRQFPCTVCYLQMWKNFWSVYPKGYDLDISQKLGYSNYIYSYKWMAQLKGKA
jgi:hypothetical protein